MIANSWCSQSRYFQQERGKSKDQKKSNHDVFVSKPVSVARLASSLLLTVTVIVTKFGSVVVTALRLVESVLESGGVNVFEELDPVAWRIDSDAAGSPSALRV